MSAGDCDDQQHLLFRRSADRSSLVGELFFVNKSKSCVAFKAKSNATEHVKIIPRALSLVEPGKEGRITLVAPRDFEPEGAELLLQTMYVPTEEKDSVDLQELWTGSEGKAIGETYFGMGLAIDDTQRDNLTTIVVDEMPTVATGTQCLSEAEPQLFSTYLPHDQVETVRAKSRAELGGIRAQKPPSRTPPISEYVPQVARRDSESTVASRSIPQYPNEVTSSAVMPPPLDLRSLFDWLKKQPPTVLYPVTYLLILAGVTGLLLGLWIK